MAEEPSLSHYLPIAGGRIIGFIPFPRVLVLCEMQSVSSRIWTRIAVFISYGDNDYTTGTIRKVSNQFATFVVKFWSENIHEEREYLYKRIDPNWSWHIKSNEAQVEENPFEPELKNLDNAPQRMLKIISFETKAISLFYFDSIMSSICINRFFWNNWNHSTDQWW